MILRCLFLGQLMVLSLLKGMGNAIMHVKEVKILLYELLDRRSQNSFGIGRSCEPLSNIETDTLCLLLEVSILNLSNICLNFFFSIFFLIYLFHSIMLPHSIVNYTLFLVVLELHFITEFCTSWRYHHREHI